MVVAARKRFGTALGAAEMQTQITFLDVERLRREAFRFTLRPPHDPARSAGLRYWDVVVDPDNVESFCDTLARSVEEAAAHPEIAGIHIDPFVAVVGTTCP